MPLARICAGGGQQWPSLPRPFLFQRKRAVGFRVWGAREKVPDTFSSLTPFLLTFSAGNGRYPFSSRGLGAATWAGARPYREPRRWPVRVQPFPLRLSPGFFSGEPTGELHVTD